MLQVEARKRHEYLEAAVSVLDGHLRYFKAGFEALKKLEPFMHQARLLGCIVAALAMVSWPSSRLPHSSGRAELCAAWWAGVLTVSKNIENGTHSWCCNTF
jgi:hypothetical protein